MKFKVGDRVKVKDIDSNPNATVAKAVPNDYGRTLYALTWDDIGYQSFLTWEDDDMDLLVPGPSKLEALLDHIEDYFAPVDPNTGELLTGDAKHDALCRMRGIANA